MGRNCRSHELGLGARRRFCNPSECLRCALFFFPYAKHGNQDCMRIKSVRHTAVAAPRQRGMPRRTAARNLHGLSIGHLAAEVGSQKSALQDQVSPAGIRQRPGI
jgi:hypothetical protein